MSRTLGTGPALVARFTGSSERLIDIELRSQKYDHPPRSLGGAAAALRLVGSGNPPLHRLLTGVGFGLSGFRELDGMIARHAELARALATELGLPGTVQAAVGAGGDRYPVRPERRAPATPGVALEGHQFLAARHLPDLDVPIQPLGSATTSGGEALAGSQGIALGTEPEHFARSKQIHAWGANIHGTNVDLWPFIVEARRHGAKFYVIDPIRNRTGCAADRHFAINPGSDLALALGMIHVILREGLEDRDFIPRHTEGIHDSCALARSYTPAQLAGYEMGGRGMSGQDAEHRIAVLLAAAGQYDMADHNLLAVVMVAGIEATNGPSLRLHARPGFIQAGHPPDQEPFAQPRDTQKMTSDTNRT